MTSGPLRASCPLCPATVPTFWHNGVRIFTGHYVGLTRSAVLCPATGWLVEDDEIVQRPRRTRSDAGQAQPSRTPSPLYREDQR